MTTLTLNREWLRPGFRPASLFDSPFCELPCEPRFRDVLDHDLDDTETADTLLEFASLLAGELDRQISMIRRPVHCLLSGGYDSRALAFLLERHRLQPMYITDGTQDPACAHTLNLLEVPIGRRYVHDLTQPDPYGLSSASTAGWAPVYQHLRFSPSDTSEATLVTGLGGGEWFSYPAAGWHRGKRQRVPHTSLRNMWLDCWPQYTVLPDAWAKGYWQAAHPYCTVEYAAVATRARREWLHENTGLPALDAVRKALLDTLDSRLAGLGWEPHRYDWRLGQEERDRIDGRAAASWLWQTHADGWGRPSDMDRDEHACTMAGFAGWCDELIADGMVIR